MTVSELRRRMRADEFNEWMGLYMLEGKERKDEAKKVKGGSRARSPRRRGRRR